MIIKKVILTLQDSHCTWLCVLSFIGQYSSNGTSVIAAFVNLTIFSEVVSKGLYLLYYNKL